MCDEYMRKVKSLSEKRKAAEECLDFYSKSLTLFEENVCDKLKNLVNNTEYSEL
jgi:hypothetical protein